jgi:hypothetical protein
MQRWNAYLDRMQQAQVIKGKLLFDNESVGAAFLLRTSAAS